MPGPALPHRIHKHGRGLRELGLCHRAGLPSRIHHPRDALAAHHLHPGRPPVGHLGAHRGDRHMVGGVDHHPARRREPSPGTPRTPSRPSTTRPRPPPQGSPASRTTAGPTPDPSTSRHRPSHPARCSTTAPRTPVRRGPAPSPPGGRPTNAGTRPATPPHHRSRRPGRHPTASPGRHRPANGAGPTGPAPTPSGAPSNATPVAVRPVPPASDTAPPTPPPGRSPTPHPHGPTNRTSHTRRPASGSASPTRHPATPPTPARSTFARFVADLDRPPPRRRHDPPGQAQVLRHMDHRLGFPEPGGLVGPPQRHLPDPPRLARLPGRRVQHEPPHQPPSASTSSRRVVA